MHIEIGDKVRYHASVVRNERQNYEVVRKTQYDDSAHYSLMWVHKTLKGDINVVHESAIILPFNTYEYGGPLGTGIRITNPGYEKVCGHPNFKQFRSEWEQLVNRGGLDCHTQGSDLSDKNGHCIWWSVIYATCAKIDGPVPEKIWEFLKRWQVRPVPRRLIDGDCLVWWPTSGVGCFEQKLLNEWDCPTCGLRSSRWDQNQAWLQYCSEACYKGECPEEDKMIDADDAYYKMEQHCKALESEVGRLENANYNGSRELQETKNKLIEISKAKTEMHKRAQKAEGENIKLKRRMECLAKGLADEIKEKSKYQSRCASLEKQMKEERKKNVRKLAQNNSVITTTKKRDQAQSRVAELELVVKDLEKDLQIQQHSNEAPILIAQAKWGALETLVKWSAMFGSIYMLFKSI